jgi:hypothetical protein
VTTTAPARPSVGERLRAWWTRTPPTRETQALVGAATAFRVGRDRLVPRSEQWQNEVWGYYDEQGEFWYGVEWLAEMISRVRLLAAAAPAADGDEPVPIDVDPEPGEPPPEEGAALAAELVAELAGGLGGRAQMLRTVTVHLTVPGEGWLVGETLPGGARRWEVRSTDELRQGRAGAGNGTAPGVEVIDEHNSYGGTIAWRPLADDSLVVRVWRPHERWRHQADSPAHHARQAMRELELANRRIQAEYLSRLASAGVWYVPEEVTFPAAPEFADEPDPFIAEFIETARKAINDPGTAAGKIPIPLRVPADLIEKFKHEAFEAARDPDLLDKRTSAIERLATVLDVPKEVLLGLGDVNHWSAWQIEESGIKTHISPVVELICHCLTIGYLWPRLAAAGVERPDRWLVWYDPSELTVRPDRSEDTFAAYDRLEATGEAVRREAGLSEADKPEGEELAAMILKRMIEEPTLAPDLLRLLALQPPGGPIPTLAVPGGGAGGAGGPAGPGEGGPAGPPERNGGPRREPRREPRTRRAPPPPPGGQESRPPASPRARARAGGRHGVAR